MPKQAIHDDTAGSRLATRAGPGDGMTTRQAAAALGVSERTVRRAVARGQLTATRERGAYRISREALARYQAAARPLPTPPAAVSTLSPRPILLAPPGPPRPRTLVPSLTPLIGREPELAACCARLRTHRPVLLTLTGPAGIGKTRLALAIAETLASAGGRTDDVADGVVVVDLAPIREPRDVVAAISRALGVREGGGRPAMDGIVSHLHPRALLLIMDNFEHVLPAAPLVSQLLATCPRLAVLATSRSPLRLRGEHVVTVPPLDAEDAPPSAGRFVLDPTAGHSRTPATQRPPPTLSQPAPAVQLFAARAQAARADFALTAGNEPAVTAICQRLDGLPLAIELAAARCATLSPEELLTRLEHRLPLLTHGPRDAAPRHHSLRTAIAWSHELLSPHEQTLFARLAVFAGGFTVEAAAEVVGEAGSAAETLDLVDTLHAHSLLVRQEDPAGAVRFRMLETVREFAWEQLTTNGEKRRLQRRHAEYFLRLAADVAGRVPRANLWWVPLEPEWGNLSAALAWSIAAHDPGLGMRLASALFGFWMLRGQIREGIDWLERLLVAGVGEPPVVRGRAAMALGYLTWCAGDWTRAEVLAAEALALANAHDDVIGGAASRFLQGFLAEARGDLPRAAASLEDARECYLAAALPAGEAAAAAHLGRIVDRLGNRDRARALLTNAITTLASPDGGIWGAAMGHADLGNIAADDGDIPRAKHLIAQGLRLHAAIGDQLAALVSLTAAARVVAEAGDDERAAQLAGAADALHERAGRTVWVLVHPAYEGAIALARARLAEAAFTAAWTAGRRLGTDEAVAAALEAITPASDADAVPAAGAPRRPLTARELTVLRLVADGQTDQEIAASLGLRVRTVNTHVANSRRKLGVASRAAAAAALARQGLA